MVPAGDGAGAGGADGAAAAAGADCADSCGDHAPWGRCLLPSS